MQLESLLREIQTPYKQTRLVVAPSYKKGRYDSHLVDAPFVFSWQNAYYMTYIGWDSTGYRTGLAVSSDLLHWDKKGIIIDYGPKGSATEFNAAMTWILKNNDLFGNYDLKPVNGLFLGTYHAYPGSGYEVGPASIGLCWSEDLLNWQIDEPVLRCDDPDAGSWEKGGLYKSCILEHEGTYYMFYNAKERDLGSWHEQIGLAVSTDLEHWKRAADHPLVANGGPGSPDECFASDPCVVKHGDTWIMFYFALAADLHARECVAFSNDLIHWEKSGGVMIDVGAPGEIDSTHAHKPSVIMQGKIIYHYYCAVSPAADGKTGEIKHNEIRGITLATSQPIKRTDG